MFKEKLKIIMMTLLVGIGSFILSTKVIAKVEEPIFYISLNFQSLLRETIGKFIPWGKDSDSFREKYYQLLQELARLKMGTRDELNLSYRQAKSLDDLIELNVLKSDSLGRIYLDRKEKVNLAEGDIVVDQNFVLIGTIEKISDKFVIVKSVNFPGLKFKVSDINGNILGIAVSVSNGFLEIDFVDPKTNIANNSPILTAGSENEIFPPGLIVATVRDVYYQNLNNKIVSKIVAKTLFDLEKGKVYILP